MADNATVYSGTEGDPVVVATDEVGGAQYQIVLAAWGVPDTATRVSMADPLPVQIVSTVIPLPVEGIVRNGALGMAGGQTAQVALDEDGNLRVNLTSSDSGDTLIVDGSAVTQPVSGTVTADAGTGPWPVTDNGGSLTVDGTVGISGTVAVTDNSGSLTTDPTATYLLASPTYSDGTAHALRSDLHGRLLVNLDAVDSQNSIPTIDLASTYLGLAPGGAFAQGLDAVGAVRKDVAADLSTGNGNFGPLQMNATGGLRVDASGAAVPITDNSGSLTVDQPTGTNLHTVVDSGTITTVSTVTAVTGITNVVHVDDNSGSLTVDGTVAATQSGTWNVVPQPVQVATTVTPTVSASAIYASGDQVGGVQTITAASSSGRAGVLTNVTLLDKGKQSAALELWLFLASPGSPPGDNAVWDLTDANLATAQFIGVVDFSVADYRTSTSNAVCQGEQSGGPVNIPYVTSGSANIFGVLVTRGTPTYASTSDLVLHYIANEF